MKAVKKCKFRYCDKEISGRGHYCSSQHKYLEGSCKRDEKKPPRHNTSQQLRMDRAARSQIKRANKGGPRYW